MNLERKNNSFLHQKAVVHENAYIDSYTAIGKGVKIESDVYISKGVKIYGNALIQAGTYIGENCIIGHPQRGDLSKITKENTSSSRKSTAVLSNGVLRYIRPSSRHRSKIGLCHSHGVCASL